jgi:hypothetical protein
MLMRNKTQHLDAAGTKRVVGVDGTSYLEYASRSLNARSQASDRSTDSGSGTGFMGIIALVLIAAIVKTGIKGYEVVASLPAYQSWGMVAVAAIVGALIWWKLAGHTAFKGCVGVRGILSGVCCSAFSLISFLFCASVFTGVVLAVIGFIANDYSLVWFY